MLINVKKSNLCCYIDKNDSNTILKLLKILVHMLYM